MAESLPDLVVVDLQMGNMGGMAVCLELRLEASYGKLGPRAGADAPGPAPRRVPGPEVGRRGLGGQTARPIRLRRAVTSLLDGGTYYDESYQPLSVVSTPVPAGA